jgi:hypothetical protein
MGYFELNKTQANQIKKWRENMGMSWRRVAEEAAKAWPNLDVDSGNQLDGRELCTEAQKTLNEFWEY